jgi:hypothetical protein
MEKKLGHRGFGKLRKEAAAQQDLNSATSPGAQPGRAPIHADGSRLLSSSQVSTTLLPELWNPARRSIAKSGIARTSG